MVSFKNKKNKPATDFQSFILCDHSGEYNSFPMPVSQIVLFCDHPQPFANVNCENVLMSHPINSLVYMNCLYSNDSPTCLNGTCLRGHSSGVVYFEFNSKLKQSKAKGL